MAAGREAFARRGLRGTSVEQLARAAAISKGAFYRFFASKEDLLLALLDEYEMAAHAAIEQATRAEPECAVDLLLNRAVRAIDDDPLLPVVMSEEGLRALQSRNPDEQQRFLQRDVRLVERVLETLRDAGITLDVPEPVLLGLLRSLVFVGLHRADIGADLVDEVTAWLKSSLRAALMTGTGRSRT
jgi:AcrR family transcriptional regulator